MWPQSGIAPRLVQLLRHKLATVVTPALRVVGNIVTGSDHQTQSIIDAGGLDAALPLLTHRKKGIRKEACWMLSNVAAGTRDQLSALLALRPLVDGVLAHLDADEWDVRKEAIWVVSNIVTGGSHEQIVSFLRNHNVVAPVCSTLDVSESKSLMVALDALEAMLKVSQKTNGLLNVPVLVDECDGLEKLENLQEHVNEDIYAKAVKIIEEFFGAEEDGAVGDSENIAPAATGGQFAFGAKAASGAIMPVGGFNFNATGFAFR